ncbi:MAG TPA: lytic transglycosylase domain-containing protein [Alphaproteobacteria bacterium]|nr:lytic transglycosylase domain-containing protein [Alphaproteobacteria bacterium]
MTILGKLLPGRKGTAALVAAVILILVSPGAGRAEGVPTIATGRAETAEWPVDVCGRMIAVAEQALGIPRQLLAAIARVESGRWISERRANFAWPWTVGAEGEGNYYPSKAAAIAAVHRLHARGIRNIDVGCLQVNLQYHPHAFKTLDAAFDPMENTIYAARLLKRLYAASGNWTKAVALYHSANPSARYVYVAKVDRLWYDEHRRANLALIEARRQRLLAMLSGGEPPPSE